jgi:hypothetical protein
MKDAAYKYIKLVLENKPISAVIAVAILALLTSLGFNVNYWMGEEVEVVELIKEHPHNFALPNHPHDFAESDHSHIEIKELMQDHGR